jgi:secondary thiamine-phosphate synthase enzyme
MHHHFTVQTNGPGLYEVTESIADWVAGATEEEALLTLFIRHSSASLLIQENADPEVKTDLLAYFHRLVPPTTDPSMRYLTHVYEGPDDMPGHIKAALLPTSLQIPVLSGKLSLGRWQGIYVFEHRKAAHQRQITALLR